MAVFYALEWDQTFGYGMRTSISKQLIKCPCIFSTSKRVSFGDFPSKILAAKAIAKKPLLYASICFSTGKKLTMNCFTQLLHNAWMNTFPVILSRGVFELSQI